MSMRAPFASLASAAALVLAAGFLAAPAQAQQQGEQQADVPTVEEQELRTYAQAYVRIADVRARLQEQMANASGQEEQAQARQQANQRMQSILEEHGLSVTRYQEITQILNTDQAQRSTFAGMVEEIRAQQEEDPPTL